MSVENQTLNTILLISLSTLLLEYNFTLIFLEIQNLHFTYQTQILFKFT